MLSLSHTHTLLETALVPYADLPHTRGVLSPEGNQSQRWPGLLLKQLFSLMIFKQEIGMALTVPVTPNHLPHPNPHGSALYSSLTSYSAAR